MGIDGQTQVLVIDRFLTGPGSGKFNLGRRVLCCLSNNGGNMLNDPDLRNVEEQTIGDFLAFELFDAGKWRAFRISLTALAVLGAAENLPAMASFERNIERIKGIAFQKQDDLNGFAVLLSDDFT